MKTTRDNFRKSPPIRSKTHRVLPKGLPVPFSRKRFGQHFLERAWAEKVVDAIGPHSSDTFIEIGPGRGALTVPLAARAGRILAFEIDRNLVRDLGTAAVPNLTIEEGDFLDVTRARFDALLPEQPTPLRVAGNLPYNVSSPILFKLVGLYAAGLPLVDATLMLQREVAERMTARPGSRQYGVLATLIGYRATVELVLALPPGAFRPVPQVRSALVRLLFHPPATPAASEAVFSGMVRAIFTRRRKMLANALLAFPGIRLDAVDSILARAGVDGRNRPENLSLADLIRLADAVAAESP